MKLKEELLKENPEAEIDDFVFIVQMEAEKWIKNWLDIGGMDFNKNPHKGELYSFIKFFDVEICAGDLEGTSHKAEVKSESEK